MLSSALLFLPHETLLALDAIVRALVRRFITGERLLEWETAAQAESQIGQAQRQSTAIWLHHAFIAWGLAVSDLVLCARQHGPMLCAAPILLLWAFAVR